MLVLYLESFLKMEEKYPLAQWLNEDLNEKEKAELLADPDFATYEKIRKYSSELSTSDFDEYKMLSNILASKKKQETKIIPLFRNWIYKVAAILVLGIGFAFLYQNTNQEKQIATIGNKITFGLPDASQVVLNSASEIEYKKSNWNRKVKLDGEAYFKVAKGKRFEVYTNLGKIAVLGTEFDVKARKNRLDVTCFEGRVQVNYKDFQIILSQGQSTTFENGKQTNSFVSNSKPEWIDNKIAFVKQNLNQIIDELEQNYDIKIKSNLFQNRELFTGKIPTNDLDVALDIISSTYQLKIVKINSKSIIFEKK